MKIPLKEKYKISLLLIVGLFLFGGSTLYFLAVNHYLPEVFAQRVQAPAQQAPRTESTSLIGKGTKEIHSTDTSQTYEVSVLKYLSGPKPASDAVIVKIINLTDRKPKHYLDGDVGYGYFFHLTYDQNLKEYIANYQDIRPVTIEDLGPHLID